MSDDLINRLRLAAQASGVQDDLRPMLEEAADEIERMHEAMDNIGEDGDEVVWRGRGEEVEFLSSKEWIVRASNEIKRLRDIIDDYARICASSSAEIRRLTGGVTEPMPLSRRDEET